MARNRASGSVGASYVDPVPGGTVGRTDQGVDVSAPPGTPVYAITSETLIGVLQNWYKGQPFYWFRDKATGAYNYVAEQFQSRLRPGDTVQQGQQIGTVAQSGTGLELGWATASGQTLARATTGYTEGNATPAGSSYRSQVFGNAAPTGGPISLAQLWIDAGGDPRLANTMAAIAMAESAGKTDATNKNSNGTVDRGPWQINSSHTQFDPARLLADPSYNARAAVAIEKTQGLTAWSTYSNGAYRQFLSGASKYTVNYGGPGGARTRPGGQSAQATGQGVQQTLQNYVSLRDAPRTAPPGTKNPFQWWKASFTGDWSSVGTPTQ